MNIFLTYIREFLKTVHPGLLLFSTGFTALLIFLNYRFCIEPEILYSIDNRLLRFAGFYLVYWTAFTVPYFMLFMLKKIPDGKRKGLWLLVMIAPAIFALKVNFTAVTELIREYSPGIWGSYGAIVSNLPSKLVVIIISLYMIWRLGNYPPPFFGATLQHFNWKPYLQMLGIMIPLIAMASTQQDFLHTYPKLRQISFIDYYTTKPWLYNLLYEISYGIDFISIELFFRGFLVLGFIRYAGQQAIIPMAVFYCSIHFGKPLAECISSYFGGMILGIVVYKTRSITGGLMVHLGIAWMMELGGFLGNAYKH